MTTSTRAVTSPRGRVWPVAVVLTLVVVGATLAKAAADVSRWVGWIPETVTYGSDVAVLLAGVTTAAFSAWMVVPLRRSRTGAWALVGCRTRAELLRSAVMVPALTAATAVTLSLVVMVGWSLAVGAAPTPAWPQALLYWIGTLGAAATLATVGGLLGWWLRGTIAVLIAPALVYLLLLLPQFTLDPPYWSSMYAVVGESWTEVTPTVVGVAARAALWLALAALALGLLVARRQIMVVALIAASAGATVGLLDAPSRVTTPQASSVVCAEGRPTVCTRGPWHAGLPRSAQIITEGYALLPDQLVPTVVGSDRGATPDQTESDLVFQVVGGVSSPTNAPDRDATLAALGEQVFLDSCEQVGEAQLTLLVWWRASLDLPLTEATRAGDPLPVNLLTAEEYERALAAAERLGRLSGPDRMAWFSVHDEQIRSCSLTPADLP